MSTYKQTVKECQEVIDGVRAYYGLEPFNRVPKKRINYGLIAFILVFVVSSCAMVYAN